MHAEDLVFSDNGEQKRGGSADIAKATAAIRNSVDSDDGVTEVTKLVAVKRFRLGGGVDKRAEVVVRLFRHVTEPFFSANWCIASLSQMSSVC